MDDRPVAGESGLEPATTAPPKRRRSRATVLSVLGELLITAGVLVLLFIGWQLWWNDWITASQQTAAASSLSQEWIEQSRATPTPTPDASAEPTDPGDPVVLTSVTAGAPFAVLYVPRYGPDYHRTIAEGTGMDVLNSTELGVGHYPDTQLPGEVGNFVVAAHRSAYGGGMHLINELQLGDSIIVQTQDGWYTYKFRSLQYVLPDQVEVLAPVPGSPDVPATDRVITLTSCNPLLSTAERIIAYGVYDSWQPLSAGPPAEIAAQVAAQSNGA
ncbi:MULTISPECIES: class E sortase [unclassified Leifsonia]|uniref:class E sortase n=1 Tax=unclassified Leifsonia TaxID=2663824 RepID=UPI000A71936D|nr:MULTISPECIES: class E sortase [unclassified Leifsonia]